MRKLLICLLICIYPALELIGKDEPILSKSGNSNIFIENKGQWNPEVKFLAKLNGMNAWITTTGVVYDYYKIEDNYLTGHVVGLKYEGIQENCNHFAKEKQEPYYNFFIGNDSTKWASYVSLYKEVIVKDAYKGIDIRYYFEDKTKTNQIFSCLRYDFIVNPGADVSEIKMNFTGQDGISINEKGELILKTSLGDIAQGDLFAYQKDGKNKNQIECKFHLQNSGIIRINTSEYDRSKPLIIDPIVFSTFLGGKSAEYIMGFTIDGSGNSFIYGVTNSSDFPISSGAYSATFNNVYTATVTKLNSSGSSLIFSTFIGQANYSKPAGIGIDGSGNIIITGSTSSNNFPVTSGAYHPTNKGNIDCFVTKLNSSGTSLINSTYFGGESDEIPYDLKISSDGSVYICGETNSTDFNTTTGAFQESKYVGNDAFVLRFTSNLSSLYFSTFLHGNDGTDYGSSATGIDVESGGHIYVTGENKSSSFPVTAGAYQTTRTNDGGYITELNSSGSAIIYSTFINPNCLDSKIEIKRIKIDGNGDIIIGGLQKNSCLPVTSGVYQSSYGGGYGDGFLMKLYPKLSSLAFATYFGGADQDIINDITIDGNNNIIVTGETFSTNFPISGGCGHKGNSDCFVAKLNSSATSLVYSFLLGGSQSDIGNFVKVDGSGSAYISGRTESTDFPIKSGCYDASLSGASDIFITKISTPIDWPQLKAISSIKFDTLFCSLSDLDTFYVKNIGFCDFNLTGKTLTGANVEAFTIVEPTSFPVNLLPGDSVRFQMMFSTLSAGNKTATLSIANTGYPNPQSISLNGVKNIIKVVFEATNLDTLKISKVICPESTVDINLILRNLSSIPTTVKFADMSSRFEILGLNPDKSLYLGLNGLASINVRFNGLPNSGKETGFLSFTDICGVTKYALLTIIVKQPIANAGKDSVICYDHAVILKATATSGTPPYQFEWSPALLLNDINLPNPLSVPLKNDTEFYLKVTDALGCTGYDTVLVIVAPQMNLSAVPNLTLCKGNSTILKPNVSGGLLPYKYKWTPAKSLNKSDTSNPFATPDVSTMYYYTITDSAGCMVHDSIMVYVQPNVKVNAGMDTTICPGYTITLTGKAEEGSKPYKETKWTPNTGLDDPNILTPKLRILKSGTYNYVLSVTDALDCIGRDTVMITVTDPPDIQIAGDTLICDGTTAILAIEPKSTENTYLWSTGETTETIAVSKEGKYSVEVTNKTGCTGLDTIEVKTYPKTIAKLKLDRSPELCAGSKLNISTESKYTAYNWSTGNIEDNITVDLPGTYFVEVTDINGCKAVSDTVKVTLVDSLKPIVLISNNGILCPNGSLNLTTEYNYTTYLWSTGETTKTITIAKPGKYSVHVKDDGGCEGTSEIIDIIQGAEPKPIISGSTILCPGRTSILLVQNDYQSYKWNTGESTKSISITNPGTYSVNVTDTNGCEGSATSTITEFKPDVIQLTDIDFGTRKVNSTSKKNIELKNTNTQQITIYSIKIKGLEVNSFTANPMPVPPKTLNQNESINIEIDYLPTSSKSYLDSLIIDITEPCVQTIAIAVKGSASDIVKTQISTSVWIPDMSAKIGQLNFCIPLMAKKDDNEPYNDKVSYKAEITLDASVMNPTTNKGTIASGKRTIEITGDNIQLTENPTKIGEICGQIFIGDRDITPIEIINFEWSDKDIINKNTNGSIKVSGICQPNIARIKLFNPVEFSIAENPVIDELTIKFVKGFDIDEGLSVEIYDIYGKKINLTPTLSILGEGVKIDVSGLVSGVYFVRIGEKVGKFVKM